MTQKLIKPAIESGLGKIGIAGDQLHMDDIAIQIEVWKARDIADDVGIDYFTSTWSFNPDGDVELEFLGIEDEANLARLEEALRVRLIEQ
ncbi:hypothetical protein AB4097_17655 [Microvirga sp. 2MCAF35]|uniref:hypothetical protein n=1 Tax=Microvirga sp. 2MCAF35 TaxID=3232987 RepID=UPI003F9DB682